MRYKIKHTTEYQYSQAVRLQPHTLLLYPRSDGAQQLEQFDLIVEPTPDQSNLFSRY